MTTAPTSDKTVVLVHGLWMRGVVFALFRRWLRNRGFAVFSFDYRSVSHDLSTNAAKLAAFVTRIDATEVHLVGHSLGGLVILRMLANHPDRRIRRVVLMGSPVAGCHAAVTLRKNRTLATCVGRSIGEWMETGLPAIPASVDVGTIAGNRSVGLGRVLMPLPFPNDGVVAVEETKLTQATDSIILSVAHSEMLISKACADQVATFLTSGSFEHR